LFSELEGLVPIVSTVALLGYGTAVVVTWRRREPLVAGHALALAAAALLHLQQSTR
jgi:hypothetical protein